MKASDLLVRALENEGVEVIFGVPGEENLDFLESLRTSSIEFVVTRHEQAAGFMAATWGRLKGKPGVCLSTLGPGATNLTTAVAYALLGGMPMVCITGQKPIRQSKQGRFQILDVVRMMEPITKFSTQIVDGNLIPRLVRECFRVAHEEKPGPVHLELPEDVAGEEVDRVPFEVTEVIPPAASETALHEAASMIAAAERPLVCIAAGANRDKTLGVLEDFIDSSGLYFVTTQMGKGAIDERHPRYLGTTALSSGDYTHDGLDAADVVLMIGHDLSEKPPFFMERGGKKVIHLDEDQAEVDDLYFPQLEVLGCTAANTRALADLVSPSPHWKTDYFERVRAAWRKHVLEAPAPETFPLVPQRVVREVRAALPSDAIVCLDNGMYKIWFARSYPAHMPNTLLLDNALASMGAGLPAAIGAKFAHPERQAVAICGDGGFMMNSQELETAVRHELNLGVVVLRDDAFGMIRWKQEADGFEDYGLTFGNPDFVKYAESYGAKGHRVTSVGGLSAALKGCCEHGGVHLIEVAVDYSENQRVLIDELENRKRVE
ncbi:MAG: acetolactate synthase large subunit [Polyangiales bacterium]